MEIIRAVEETDFLPSYLAITQRALQLLEDEAVEIHHLAEVIGTEQALTAKSRHAPPGGKDRHGPVVPPVR